MWTLLFLLKNFPLQISSNVSLYAIPTPKNNDVRAVAIESLMRKFALIAIRKTALCHCAFSLILTVIGQRTWIHCIPFRYSRACSRISRLCIPAWVLTARYREHDKWKAKRLSFICQIPFLSVGAMAAVNVDTSCCPKDPFNPSRENFALILALSMSRNVINSTFVRWKIF